jgi:triacylglycerol esterase/lipase EstA (alpha/beta hydrolase family)
MGGLAVRAWLSLEPAAPAALVHRVVTIGTPHGGTAVAALARTANGRDMRIGSGFLRGLEQSETPDLRARFTCFWSDCDNVVFPSAHATLAGADSRCLTGRAHLHLVGHPLIRRFVFDALWARGQMS